MVLRKAGTSTAGKTGNDKSSKHCNSNSCPHQNRPQDQRGRGGSLLNFTRLIKIHNIKKSVLKDLKDLYYYVGIL